MFQLVLKEIRTYCQFEMSYSFDKFYCSYLHWTDFAVVWHTVLLWCGTVLLWCGTQADLKGCLRKCVYVYFAM